MLRRRRRPTAPACVCCVCFAWQFYSTGAYMGRVAHVSRHFSHHRTWVGSIRSCVAWLWWFSEGTTAEEDVDAMAICVREWVEKKTVVGSWIISAEWAPGKLFNELDTDWMRNIYARGSINNEHWTENRSAHCQSWWHPSENLLSSEQRVTYRITPSSAKICWASSGHYWGGDSGLGYVQLSLAIQW